MEQVKMITFNFQWSHVLLSSRLVPHMTALLCLDTYLKLSRRAPRSSDATWLCQPLHLTREQHWICLLTLFPNSLPTENNVQRTNLWTKSSFIGTQPHPVVCGSNIAVFMLQGLEGRSCDRPSVLKSWRYYLALCRLSVLVTELKTTAANLLEISIYKPNVNNFLTLHTCL